MSEGAFSGEAVGSTQATSPGTTPVAGGGPAAQGDGWKNEKEKAQATAPAASRKLVFLAVALLVIVVPVCVGVFAFMNPAADDGEATAENTVGAMESEEGAIEVAFADPLWRRPDWADPSSGITAFELPAASDVLFAAGRLRPTLGLSCSRDEINVHVVTGGTALVDPQTSGHVVHLTFDGGNEHTQQWTAADDMRALFAPAPLAIADQISRATTLSFGFSHYMSGPVVVEFDLRGADEVIDSMAEPCGWVAD